ncbi:SRPBCC domain-containing protein [Paenibacillus sp. GCM10027627]|uniref:SRPBCC family protein n=1 Tax=unclassified Paenibacillus TaxID=185978 RepID=UPI003641ED8A
MEPLTIYHRSFIKASPAKVYETIATGEGWDAWFTQGTSVDARPGGRIHFRFKDFGPDHITLEDGGTVLEAIPEARFVYQWTPGDTTTTISFVLTKIGEGTLVSVEESGYKGTAADLKAFADCAVGWGEALTLLKFYLEHGVTYGPVPRHQLEKPMTEQYSTRTDHFINSQQ